jgi:hypothetical protein
VPGLHQYNNEKYCLFAGKLGRNVYFYTELTEENEFVVSDLEKVSATTFFPKLFEKQKYDLKIWKNQNFVLTLGGGDIAKDYYLISQGGISGESVLLEGEEVKYKIQRGYNIFGITESNDISFLLNVDLCTDPRAFENSPTLSELIDQNQPRFKGYLVSIHDSAYCRQSEYPPRYARLSRTEWRKIAFREPYIALLDADKQFVGEYGGKRDSSIKLHLKTISANQ